MRKNAIYFLLVFSISVFYLPQTSLSAQMIKKKPLPLPQQNRAIIVTINPSALKLQQGVSAAIVTVEGKYLETILAVKAIRHGQEVGEISVKQVQPWPTSRKIKLKAGLNAPAAQGYQMRVIGKAGLKEFTFDIPLAVFSLEVVRTQLTKPRGPVPHLKPPPISDPGLASRLDLKITGIIPDKGEEGSEVIIKGSGFLRSQDLAVRFAGPNPNDPPSISAQVLEKSASSIKVKVPLSAVTGNIKVVSGTGNDVKSCISGTEYIVLHKPIIESFSPSSGHYLDEVNIIGYNFTTPLSSYPKFYFNDMEGSVSQIIPRGITEQGARQQAVVKVPSRATSGPIKVINLDGSHLSAKEFQVIGDPPEIFDFTPDNGGVGTEVTISGRNFGPASHAGDVVVVFGRGASSMRVIPTSCNSDTIRVKVPAEGETGEIFVKTPAGECHSGRIFYYPPGISNIFPNTGVPGVQVDIKGSHFDSYHNYSQFVKFNGVLAKIVSTSLMVIKAEVPVGVTTGHVTVENHGGTATSPEIFSVLRGEAIDVAANEVKAHSGGSTSFHGWTEDNHPAKSNADTWILFQYKNLSDNSLSNSSDYKVKCAFTEAGKNINNVGLGSKTLGPNSVDVFPTNLGRLPAGIYHVVCTVDPEEVLWDTDRANNAKTFVFTVLK